jgi:peptide/nickel transport system ATP-binding protein
VPATLQTFGTPVPLLSVEGLSVFLMHQGGSNPVLDHVSLTVLAGRTMALVGESGCGKTVTSLAMMGLLPMQMYTSGRVLFDGIDLLALQENQLARIRGNEIAMVFQDSMSSLNPVLTIGFQISETLRRHRALSAHSAAAETRRLLDRVQIPGAAQRFHEFPHELSGGMCQRVMIAMAIACGPRLLIADEPTTALDVTVQAQILALLKDIQKDLGMSLIMITHDLGVVAHMAEFVAVMYGGRIVEYAPVGRLFDHPAHPYTQALLRALPYRASAGEPLRSIPGTVPPIGERTSGCSFRPRCNAAQDLCARTSPETRAVGALSTAACHYANASDACQ